MKTERTGGIRWIRGRPYVRIRITKGKQPAIPITGCTATDDKGIELRRALIVEVAAKLIDAGRWFDVETTARSIGAAKTDRELRILGEAANRLAAAGPGIGRSDDTFSGFASRWTRGDLAREYPHHVATKDVTSDVGILNLHINPIVGHIDLKSFELEHADSVMRLLPEELGDARRRHVAQVIHRVLKLAAFPAKIISASPIPTGWLPKLGKGKALTYLFPDEDKKLLASSEVPLDYRLYYGVLAREGMREGEALGLEWTDIDLERGAFILDENKTDDPRSWAGDPAVIRAMKVWKKCGALKAGPFKRVSKSHIAERLRSHLKAAGVDRVQLFEETDKRRPVRIHDLRATFVTISLANGKSETWVQDRTGHRSTLMIARYRRAARTVAELGLGELAEIDKVIPEIVEGEEKLRKQPPSSRHKHIKSAVNDSQLVAPPGLEPERSFEPEILNRWEGVPGSSRTGEIQGGRALSEAHGPPDPHPDPHPQGDLDPRRSPHQPKPSIARAKGGAVGARLEDESGRVLARTAVAEGEEIDDIIDRLKVSAQMGGRQR